MLRTPAGSGQGIWGKRLFSSERVLAPEKPTHHLVTSTALGNSCQQEGQGTPSAQTPRCSLAWNQAGRGAGEDLAKRAGGRAAFRQRRERGGRGAAPTPSPPTGRARGRPSRWQTPPNKALAGGTAGSGREAGTEPRLEHGSPVPARRAADASPARLTAAGRNVFPGRVKRSTDLPSPPPRAGLPQQLGAGGGGQPAKSEPGRPAAPSPALPSPGRRRSEPGGPERARCPKPWPR